MSSVDTSTAGTRDLAQRLAAWAQTLTPDADDLALADRSLLDTVAVTLAAANHPLVPLSRTLASAADGPVADAAQWAMLAHVIDFDDLHVPSTTHISTVCVPVALAAAPTEPERARLAYLAGAGVMARLGIALGWNHYASGWHATTTAGALAAAVTAGVALELSEEQLAAAISLAVPSAGGVQEAFGTDAKSLQVGMAAAAGVRAALLARDGAQTGRGTVEAWLRLLGGDPNDPLVTSPGGMQPGDLGSRTIPGGLAVKLYPACYALQRPIGALRGARTETVTPDQIRSITITTPKGTVQPLVHHDPQTGLEGKFSLEYAAATALLDTNSGFSEFEDAAILRADARALMERTTITLTEGGEGLLDGAVAVEITYTNGEVRTQTLSYPPGSPENPPSAEDVDVKVRDCLARAGLDGVEDPVTPSRITWESAAGLLRRIFTTADQRDASPHGSASATIGGDSR